MNSQYAGKYAYIMDPSGIKSKELEAHWC